MKAILVLTEMPDCCGECCFCYPAVMNEHEEIYQCFLTGLDASTTILDDCPLHPLPERKEEMDYLAAGYNKCLDDILEGE